MNIQRKYSLPNCTILLEGLSDASRAVHFQELRPELSILVNAECYLAGYEQPLIGGREFFESLVQAVSAYAQEFLSQVPNPQAHNTESEFVQLQKIDGDRHRLTVHSETLHSVTDASYPQPKSGTHQVDLNTVQLFDLVEAVDQFFADSQTLPEISLQLQPVPRRYGGASQALIKQAVPATVGAASLAAAALALSVIPVPKITPGETKPQTQSSNPANSTVSPTPVTNAATNNAISPIYNPVDTPTASATPVDAPTPTASATPVDTPTPTANATPAVQDLEALLNTVPEITDPSQLKALNRQVYNSINAAWTARKGISEDLVYRVGVAADGSIVGYKAVNSKANDAIEKTPLPNLLYNPAKRNPISKEPIAQFRVVFTGDGVPQVSPWRGYVKPPDVVGAKITDGNTIKTLNQKLSQTIQQNAPTGRSYTKDLKYRVAVNKDGVIADYEPLNQVAFDYFRETPLPQMFQSVYGSNIAAPNSKEALAHFQVVFKPDGKVEIAPWQGYK
ncbi:DUF4335 domain-containing protein [Calothrix sp. 336/3]|uniref:DUF4335 domain-containing protein n=1 Tax=Calothrix sp. 336/3 TaxID=1337936 RepID=UPI0004E4697B|nr:DUF4335 domain-containing protein [Calothrix sp. 336/3]AKG21896.1 hypothetical protein IJ00_12045 [Calothrix sp. 336/3]